MDRVQRSGLIALAVLLLTALGAHYVGSLPGSDATVPPRLAAQEPGTLEGVKFLPPEQRQFFVGPADFVRPPVRNPMMGVPPRNIDADEPVNEEHGTSGSPAANAGEQGSSAGSGSSELAHGGGASTQNAGAVVPLDDVVVPGPNLPQRQPGRFIRVRENDNLTRIAKRELNDGSRWREIASLNGLKSPYRVRLGQRLQMPDGNTSAALSGGPSSIGGNAAPNSSNGASNAAANSSGSSIPAGGRLYTVGKNETASHISLRFYGSADKWKRILDFNGIQDPRDLAAGQVIRIPPQ